MPLSKKKARELLVVIDEYAEAKSSKDWQDDQGYGSSVDAADKAHNKARADLLLALGLTNDKEKS